LPWWHSRADSRLMREAVGQGGKRALAGTDFDIVDYGALNRI
jgi:hypothetical protein